MSNLAERYWQAAIEVAHGTALAADRKIYALGAIPKEGQPKSYVKQSRANYIENYDAVKTHTIVDGWPMELPAAPFDDLAWWFQLAIKGGVTPTGAGPYVWTFNDAASSEDLDSATFEVADNVGAFQIPYAMVKSWEMSGKGGTGPTPIKFKAELLGQKLTPAHTMTGAISDRNLVGNYMNFQGTQLYIDNTAGGIGGSEVQASLEEFTIKCDNKLEARFTGGNTDYFSSHRRQTRYLEFTIIMLFNSTNYSEFQNKFQANEVRYIQLKNTGSGNDLFTFNLASKPESWEWPEDGGAQRVALMGRSMYDPTLGYSFQAAVQNDVASI